MYFLWSFKQCYNRKTLRVPTPQQYFYNDENFQMYFVFEYVGFEKVLDISKVPV